MNKNIILLGKSGTGKTHLATALGIEACDRGIRTKFITGCGLVNELIEARDEKRFSLFTILKIAPALSGLCLNPGSGSMLNQVKMLQVPHYREYDNKHKNYSGKR